MLNKNNFKIIKGIIFLLIFDNPETQVKELFYDILFEMNQAIKHLNYLKRLLATKSDIGAIYFIKTCGISSILKPIVQFVPLRP